MKAMVKVGIVAYKISKDDRDHKIAFFTLAYHEGKNEVWKKVVTQFPNLDFAFLDEDSEVEKELALGAEITAVPLALIA